ncbi:MAG: 2-oxoacid:acceptor oxidoreductase family protein, partial [Firmicutes bacterium]|nr:2-oxoacid:acceptor oxidoreductase family protein [Bacillota bacterium]
MEYDRIVLWNTWKEGINLKKITVDGNEACARVSYYFTEVAGIYPITPSSPMAEHIDEWSKMGVKNLFGDQVEVVEMQSEAGAAGMIHGSLQAGCLTSTYTASQGLLLMIPNMYKIAGEMLPCVIHVAARSLSTHALSIFGDHQDIYAARATGFAYLCSSSVQQASDLALVSHLATLRASIPFLHFFDGFRTSHEIDKITVLEDDEIKSFVEPEWIQKFRSRALTPQNKVTRGTAQNDDIYFQETEVRNAYYNQVPDIVNEYMKKVNQKMNTDYKPFNYYGSPTATVIIVAMGSVCETIKETIDDLNQNGYQVGLIEVHLYRPFSKEYLIDVLPVTVRRIAVLDRTKEPGSEGEPLYLDVKAALSDLKDRELEIVGGRYGLSSKNTTPSQIKAVYDALEDGLSQEFTIGITDDITNLSLPIDPYYKIKNAQELLIYGYGSDGMVSASKTIMKLVGDTTDKYVQGYFQYDSKKSGGVTTSHLRFGHHPIRSTYYVENPSMIVVTKDYYFNEFELLNDIETHGIVLINTSKTGEELTAFLNKKVKSKIAEKKLQVYYINAYELASKIGLRDKISTIMETVILNLTKLVDTNTLNDNLKQYVEHTFSKKGESVVLKNQHAIDVAMNALEVLDISHFQVIASKEEEEIGTLDMIRKR